MMRKIRKMPRKVSRRAGWCPVRTSVDIYDVRKRLRQLDLGDGTMEDAAAVAAKADQISDGSGDGGDGTMEDAAAEADQISGGSEDGDDFEGRNKDSHGSQITHTKDANFNKWYCEVLSKGNVISYYGTLGSYILSPVAMHVWNTMKTLFDHEIKSMNCEDWSTKDLDLTNRERASGNFASEIESFFSGQISRHCRLPLRLNQWCTDPCLSSSNPTPFMRSREFLWQEGHSAFATKEEADAEVLEILELYRRLYEEYLAVPVLTGQTYELQRFASGVYTTFVEAFIPSTGFGIRGATSRCLGDLQHQMVWKNSWAYSTSTIGVMVMVHGDDKGLVLPPKVSEVQVIVIPVPCEDEDVKEIMNACSSTVKKLCDLGIHAEADLRQNHSPGWKSAQWEMKGVPLRIEMKQKDLANNQVSAVRRDNGSKVDLPMADLGDKVKGVLDGIQKSLFDAAKQKRDACIQVTNTWDEFIQALEQKKLILAPWCNEEDVEQEVAVKTEGILGAVARTLCSPFDQPELPEGTLCFASGKPAKIWTYWGRTYPYHPLLYDLFG